MFTGLKWPGLLRKAMQVGPECSGEFGGTTSYQLLLFTVYD